MMQMEIFFLFAASVTKHARDGFISMTHLRTASLGDSSKQEDINFFSLSTDQ